MFRPTHAKIRIFVACTQELSVEREMIHTVADELNKTVADALGVFLDVVDWIDHASSRMGRPEQGILDQLPINTWDIFIGMLWLRFGSPTGEMNKNNSEYFLSGTEEEFNLAYDSWSKSGRPKIMFYRCNRVASPENIDHEQFERVNKFFFRFNASGPHPGLIKYYDSLDKFIRIIYSDLIKVILELSKQVESNKSLAPVEDFRIYQKLPIDKGFLSFFTPEMNEERNLAKKNAIVQENYLLRLLASVGHSYVANLGNRFGNEIIKALESGVCFRVLILNPWTEMGLSIALAETDSSINTNSEDQIFDFSKVDVISIIEKSVYYKFSLLEALAEYAELQRKFGDLIEIRLTTHDIPATVLLSTVTGFFEPFMSINLKTRSRNALHTFEVQFNSECYFYKHVSDFFNFAWQMSGSYEDFINQENDYKNRLKINIKNKH